jgi:WD40 repeat protein
MHEYLIDKLNRLASQSPNAKQRANLQLRQYLSQYSRDESIRIPLTKLWSIKRHADLKHTEQEKKLLKRSLRSSLLKASGASFFVIIAAILLAAYLSVREEWDEVRLRDGHTAAVRRAIFSPDGKRIVSVGEDKQVIVWDFERRERIATLTDHTDWVTSVAFSPDGKWFATGSRDTTVIVWNAVRLEKVKVLREHRSEVCSLAFSPDGRLLASASTAITTTPDNRTVIWKVGQWEKVHELHVGSSYQNILFSPNSHWLLSSSEGQIWDLTTGQEIATTEKGLGANWRAVSPDATRVVNIDGDGNVFFWEMKEFWQTGQYKLLSKHRAHHDNGRTVAISPDGKLAATGSENIILWDVAMQTILSRFEHEAIVWSVDFSPDGRWLVSSHGDGSILLWNVTERKLVANFNEHGGAVRAVAYSLDGKRIATASEDNSVIIWDAETRRKKAALVGHETKVTAIAFSPDNGSVASCDFDGKIIYWRVAERRPLWTDKLNSCNAVAFSPDGRWVATTRGLYETANGRIAVNLNHMLMHGLAFSSDGKWLVYASALGKLSLLEVGTWKVVEEVIADNHSFISVSFSPDSQWLVTGEDEKNVRLWSVRPLCEVAIIGTHARRIKSVAFSPDGRQVASASDDQTIALWDVWGRKLISQIGTHPAPVLSVAFSPDGKRLVSGEHDRAVRLYTRHSVLWGYRLN